MFHSLSCMARKSEYMFAEDEEETTNSIKGNVISKSNIVCANTDVRKVKENQCFVPSPCSFFKSWTAKQPNIITVHVICSLFF